MKFKNMNEATAIRENLVKTFGNATINFTEELGDKLEQEILESGELTPSKVTSELTLAMLKHSDLSNEDMLKAIDILDMEWAYGGELGLMVKDRVTEVLKAD